MNLLFSLINNNNNNNNNNNINEENKKNQSSVVDNLSKKQLINCSDKDKITSVSNVSKSNIKNSEQTIMKVEGGDVYWKFLGVMKKVKKYVHILSNMNYYRRYENMQSINFNAINDLSYYLQTDIDFTFQNFLKKFQVIEPNSTKALVWNIVLLIVLFLQNVFIPLKISMNIVIGPDSPLYYVTFILPCAVLFFDVLINFNIAYYEKGILVSDNLRIIQNYIKFDFFLNLLTTFAFLLSQQIYLIEGFLMIRLIQIPSLISKIDEHFQIQQRFNTLFELGKLLVLIFFCAHLVGCGFHYVAQLSIINGIEITWLHKQDINESGIEIRYLFSIYFAFITMVTVGYGDITPYTPIEKVYTIVVTIFSCGMFGYSMNTIGAIFQEISKKEADFKQVKYDMTQYMRSRGIPMYLQIKVLKNIEYTNALKGNQVKKGEQIMESLTQTLKNQIKREFYGNILSNYKLFNLNFSQEARNEICLQMKEIIVQPGEMIYEQAGINDKIYFLYRGQVEIVIFNLNRQYVTTGKAHAGSMLGQLGFFTNLPENYGTRSCDTSYLLYCDRSNFIQTLAKYKTDYEVFFKLRDNIMIFNREWDTTCFSCNKLGHQTNNCSFYNLNLVNFMIVQRYNLPITQQRDQNKYRMKHIRFKSLTQRNLIMKTARKVRINFFFEAFEGNLLGFQDEDLELQQNDMEFMIFIPCIHYENECLVYSEREISEFSDGEYEREQQEHNYYQQFKPKGQQKNNSEKLIRGRMNIFDVGLKSKLQEIQNQYKQNQQYFKGFVDKCEDSDNSEDSSNNYQDNQIDNKDNQVDQNDNQVEDDENLEDKQDKKENLFTQRNFQNIQDDQGVFQKNSEKVLPQQHTQQNQEVDQENVLKNGSILTSSRSRDDNNLSAREIKVFDQQDKSTSKNQSRKKSNFRESSKDLKNSRSSSSSIVPQMVQTKDNLETESEVQGKDVQMLSLGIINSFKKISLQNICLHQQQSESNIPQYEELGSSPVHTVTGFGQLHNINSPLTRVKQQNNQNENGFNDQENLHNNYILKQERSIADLIQKDALIKGKLQGQQSRESQQLKLNIQKSYQLIKQPSLSPLQSSNCKVRGSLIKGNLNDFSQYDINQNIKEQQRKRSSQFASFNGMNMLNSQFHQNQKYQKSQKQLDMYIQQSSLQQQETINLNQMLQRDSHINSRQKLSFLLNEPLKAGSSLRNIQLQKFENTSIHSQFNSFQIHDNRDYSCDFKFMIDYFDISKEYLGYYPHNNISNVMKKCKAIYNKQIIKKIKIRSNIRKLSQYQRKQTMKLQTVIII